MILTACRFFIGAIFTVPLAVAQLRFVNALGHSVSTATRTQEFVVRTSDGRTVHFVAVIRAIEVAVTVEIGRYAQ